MQIINLQPVEKRDYNTAGLQVNSIFYTFQGESIFAGRPAIFIRLAGCNLQCPACDTEYTKREFMTVDEILDKIAELIVEPCKNNKTEKMLVVITGGEPFRQELKPLTDSLLSTNKFIVQIETNGTIYQDLDPRVFIVCSPKTGNINSKLEGRINALKYVVDEGNVDTDGFPLFALDHPNSGCVYKPSEKLKYVDIYIQPADHKDPVKNNINLEVAKEICLKHNRLLCIQIHKQIGVD
jgi:organic radical activating enzyme